MACEYCNGTANPIAEEGSDYICINRFNDLMFVFTTDQYHLWEVPINFCPMCGERLGDE